MEYAIKHSHLQQLLEATLLPLINEDYVLLDLPYHSNIGDILIWQGELELLKKTGIINALVIVLYSHIKELLFSIN